MTQQNKRFEKDITVKLELDYLLYVPSNYDSTKKWPLILFLHGAGERGDDLELVKWQGIPSFLDSVDDFPFLAISPQCPEDSYWDNHFNELDGILNDVEQNFSIDTERLYLTGLSMGGYGTWNFACIFPDRFAALIPICGGCSYPELLSQLKEVPIWAFHGAKDDVVPFEESKSAIDILNEYGSSAKLTIYPDLGHNSWTTTYENDEIYQWLLSHKNKNITS